MNDISNRIDYQESDLSSDITFIPTTGSGAGTAGDPKVWSFTTIFGHSRKVTITAPSHGTITVIYDDESNTEQTQTATHGGSNVEFYVAQTCILKSITATGDSGYDNPATLTVGGNDSFTNGDDDIVRGDISISASFNPHTYNITLNAGDHGAANGSATVVFNTSALATSSLVTANAGYEVEGYYAGETKVLNANGTFAADDVDGYITDGKWSKYDADATLTAKFNTVTLYFRNAVYWDEVSGWVPACVPTIDHDVVIERTCFIRRNNAQAKSVKIDHYRDLSPRLDIKNDLDNAGALLVKEGILAKHTAEGGYEATDGLDLSLEIGQLHNAALIC